MSLNAADPRPRPIFLQYLLLVLSLSLSLREPRTEFWFAGGLFVLVTIPLSVWDVAMHLRHYENPKLQRYIIRIIWMVPIYSIDAWFGLKPVIWA